MVLVVNAFREKPTLLDDFT